MKLSDLVLDFNLYPRGRVDNTHVSHIVGALEAGAELPPIIADAASLRIVDGFHRHKALMRLYGADAEVAVDLVEYPDDGALFLDAIRANAGHGRPLDVVDRVRCITRAADFGVEVLVIAKALNTTPEAVAQLVTVRTARDEDAKPVPLKFPVRHLAGQTLTPQQVAANRRLGGNRQVFFINQLIALIEADMFDWADPVAVERLWRLGELIAANQTRRAA